MRFLVVSWGRKLPEWPQLHKELGDNNWLDAETLTRDPGQYGAGWWRGWQEKCLSQVQGPYDTNWILMTLA